MSNRGPESSGSSCNSKVICNEVVRNKCEVVDGPKGLPLRDHINGGPAQLAVAPEAVALWLPPNCCSG